MRQITIFVLTLPFLALAILWVPISILFCVIVFPVWGLMAIVFTLRGEDGMWEIFLIVPLIGLSMYLMVTGFCPRLSQAIDNL